ncbi:pyruvate dehydrogenase phosphatase regulatory subunit, mitochondrial-like isoform 1-T1 [Rhynchonycteris naso]
MADYSNKLYHQLEQETGIQTGYTRTGSIFLAQTQDRLVSLKRINSRLNVIGIPSEIISLKKVTELHPLLNVHDLVGAMHVPEDAVVSSADVALALASAASQQEPLLSSLLRRMPELETLEILKLVNCPETFTPDMRCIMGESPLAQGYFVLAGMNSAGLSFGGGAGK